MLRNTSLFIAALLFTACPDTPAETTDGFEGSTSGTTSGDGMSSTSAPGSTGIVMGETGAPDPTTGDPDSATTTSGEPETTTLSLDLDCPTVDAVLLIPGAMESMCDEHPFERPEGCSMEGVPTCDEMMSAISAADACDGVDLCDYIVCADALSTGTCGARPASCGFIIACMNTPNGE
jgi:hypothetical protein